MKCKLCKTRVPQPNTNICKDCDKKGEFKKLMDALDKSGFNPLNK